MTSTYTDMFAGSVVATIGKQPVVAATTGAIALTGSQTIDGVVVSDHTNDSTGKQPDRVLVKNQADTTTNGIYVVNNSGAWYRAQDFSGPSGVVSGQIIIVNGGTTNVGLWTLTTADPISIDGVGGGAVSNLTFAAYLPTITGGTLAALTVTGNETVGGTLGVTGAATLSSGAVSGNLTVTGTTTLAAANAGALTATGINSSPVGATTPSTGAFTTLAASGAVSGSGFSTYLASPPAIGGTAAAAGSFTSMNGGQLAGLRNRIINGSMRIDQRNAGNSQTITAAAALAYTVDRFYAYCTGANVTGQQVAGTAPTQNVYQFTGASSVTAIGFGQRIEAANIYDLEGSTATLSVELSNSLLTTVTWTAYYATTTADTFGSLASPTVTQIATGTFTVNSTPTVYSTQIALPAGAEKGVQIVFSVGAQTSGTWTISKVQLENGSVATPFERRPLGSELALCQRYFYAASVYVPAGAAYGITCPRKVSMRVTPTYAGGGSGFSAQNNNAETAGLSQTTGANQSLTLSAEL